MTLKRLLNRREEQSNDRLRKVCETFDVQVYPKVRLADVVPIERSGISDFEYSYAMRAHLDFVVVDSSFAPVFAVEFDGRSHEDVPQQTRDVLKNQLCRRFGLPLLRIDGRYLDARYYDMDLLSWLVGVVLFRRRSSEMFEAGELTLEQAAVDPVCCAPYVVSYPARKRLTELSDQGLVDHYPTWVVGADSSDKAYGIGGVWLASDEVAVAEVSLSYQGFSRLAEDLAEELLYIKMVQAAESVLAGKVLASSVEDFQDAVAEFTSSYDCHSSLGVDPRNGGIVRLG